MKVRDVVVVRAMIDAGPNDRIYDAMLLAGPLVVVILAVVGRNPLTVTVALLYLVAFVGYVLYRGASREGP